MGYLTMSKHSPWYRVDGDEDRIYTNDYRDAVQMANYLDVKESDIKAVQDPPPYGNIRRMARKEQKTIVVRWRPIEFLIALLGSGALLYLIYLLAHYAGAI
jgi:hypothetical protein